MQRGEVRHNIEKCPHCGGVVRARQHVSNKAIAVINDWIAEGNMIDSQWDARPADPERRA